MPRCFIWRRNARSLRRWFMSSAMSGQTLGYSTLGVQGKVKFTACSWLFLSAPSPARSKMFLFPPRWAACISLAMIGLLGCRQPDFPNYPPNYREYAYISNGGSNTVTVLDLVNMRQDRVIAVGSNPSGLGINPHPNEVYGVNTGSGTVSVINAETNTVAATIRVQRKPYFIDVDTQGERAYVANSASNNVSV